MNAIDEAVEERSRVVASSKRGELWKLGEERIKRGQYERRCALRSLSRCDVAGEVGSRTVDGPPEQQGTETPSACAPWTLLMMGYDGAFNGRCLMGTDEANDAIDVERVPPH